MSQPTANPWTDDDTAALLRLRMKSFWIGEYIERIILPLRHLPLATASLAWAAAACSCRLSTGRTCP